MIQATKSCGEEERGICQAEQDSASPAAAQSGSGMGEASVQGRSWDGPHKAQLLSIPGTSAYLVGDGLVVDEVSKGDSG